MKVNTGEQKEAIIVQAIDNEKIENLEENLRTMVKFIFPNAKQDDIVQAK